MEAQCEKRCCIVIPAYEPDRRLIDLCDVLYNKGYCCIVVDDGSGLDYEEIFQELERQNIIVLHHAVNLGKGRALKDAFNYILYNYPSIIGVITADSDGQHTVADIEKIAKELIAHPNTLILGCREFSGTEIPWKSRLGNELTKKIFSFLCGLKVADTQTGLRGIPRNFMKILMNTPGERFEFETNMLLKCKDEVRIKEIPIETIYDSKKNHSTHFDPFRDSFMIYKVIFSYAFASIASVIVDFIIFITARKFGCNILFSTAMGRSVSSILNFTLNKNLVFRVKGNVSKQFIGYFCLVVISGAISAFSVECLYKFLSINEVIIKACVDTLLFFFNYYIQRVFIFVRDNRKS